jgi:hypothetical protein
MTAIILRDSGYYELKEIEQLPYREAVFYRVGKIEEHELPIVIANAKFAVLAGDYRVRIEKLHE